MPDTSPLVLYHHPFSRAATVLWMLEETQCPYELRYVDLTAGEQRRPEFLQLNPMGKIPVLVDGGTVITETAAIGAYLADRYAPGKLAPALDEKERGTYLRWCFFPAAVIEPGAMAKAQSWTYRSSNAGWGDYEAMLTTVESAIAAGPWLLGERFSMADVILGSTLRYLLRFKMLEARPSFLSYVERLSARPASKAADAKNGAIVAERGLG
jgi:glutathione S-transferase